MHYNRRHTGRYDSDQNAVWNEVDELLGDFNTHSASANIADGYTAAKDRITAYRRHIKLHANARGFIVTRGKRILGMDLFDSDKTLKHFWKRLSDAYFVEAAREKNTLKPGSKKIAEDFIGSSTQIFYKYRHIVL